MNPLRHYILYGKDGFRLPLPYNYDIKYKKDYAILYNSDLFDEGWFREKYGISSDDFLIVTGGKIDLLKNIHILAEAVAKSEYVHIKILIFGSIQEEIKEVFNRLESNRVICIGWQPSNEVYRYFYAADFVMFPGLHSVMWEQAVASKVPCAFSKINGFEHIDIGGNCVLMEGKDVAYYQRLIDNIYQDQERQIRMKEASESEKCEQFLYSRIAQSVIDDVN